MSTICCGKFVSQKVRKIRWKSNPFTVNQKPDIFVGGSWQNEINKISVWQNLQQQEPGEPHNSFTENDAKLLCEIAHDGDVTDLKFLTSDVFISSSSDGTVSLFKHTLNQEPSLQLNWKNVHHFPASPAPCTGVDSHGESLVSVGEDGRIVYYNIKRNRPVDIIEADSCALSAVVYAKLNEVITSNTQGQIAVWDLRSSKTPSKLLFTGDEQTALLCMNRHPTEPSLLACGSESGTVCFWDLRQEKYPATVLSAHNGPVLEIKFHPISPHHLFTCSMDGMIWHWNSSSLAASAVSIHLKTKPSGSVMNPWLSCGASKHHIDICSLIPSSNKPINSLDIVEDTLICGSDNEAIYIISKLKL